MGSLDVALLQVHIRPEEEIRTMASWLKVAFRKDVVSRGLKVGVIVGTILIAINQGDLLLAGSLPLDALWKIPVTYCVPYCVSTYASVSAIRSIADTTGSRM